MKPGDIFYFSKESEDSKDNYVRAMLAAEELFRREFGIPLRVAYGTLLGAIREHDFIADDTDIDMTYVSMQTDKKRVIDEMNRIYDRIINMGFVVADFRKQKHNAHGGQIHVVIDDVLIDITTSWFNEQGECIAFPYGKLCMKSDVVPLATTQFRKHTVLIPNRSEVILNHLYRDWRTPVSRGKDGTSRKGFKRQWNYGLLT